MHTATKTLFTLLAIQFTVGCVTLPSQKIENSVQLRDSQSAIKKNIHISRLGADTTKVLVHGNMYALIELKGDHWELIAVSDRYIRRSGSNQEVFLVEKNLEDWETIPPQKSKCTSDKKNSYSACTSLLAKYDESQSGLFSDKVAKFDDSAVKAAINSIPDEQAMPIFEVYIKDFNEKLERKRKADIAREKQVIACEKEYNETTERLRKEAKIARAEIAAGAPYTNERKSAIAADAYRMTNPFASGCGR